MGIWGSVLGGLSILCVPFLAASCGSDLKDAFVEGVVLDATSEKPVIGAEVCVSGLPSNEPVCSLSTDSLAGTYQIRVSWEGPSSVPAVLHCKADGYEDFAMEISVGEAFASELEGFVNVYDICLSPID